MQSTQETPKTAGPCLCDHLRKAARAVTQLYNGEFSTSGCRVTQATILTVARQAGPMTLSQMADELVMDRTTLTRNLSLLEKDGFVQVDIGDDDRRERWIRITEQGEAVLQTVHHIWERVQEKMTQKLGKDRMKRLHEDLQAVIEAVKGT